VPSPTLPTLAPATVFADYAAISGCGAVLGQAIGPVSFSPPFYTPLCDYAVFNVQINAGLFTAQGILLGKYARTWRDVAPNGTPLQIWRFLLNGDLFLNLAPGASGSGLIPPVSDAPYFQPVHFVGFIDYACDFNQSPDIAFSLSHWPGCIQHSSFSTNSIPALASGRDSFHIVGPAPFIFAGSNGIEPQGPIAGDSSRHSDLTWVPFSYQCFGEAPADLGSLTTNFDNCLLPPNAGPPDPYKHQTLSTIACCGVPFNISTVPLPGTPVPTGLVAFPLGSYAGLVFPFTRSLTIYMGALLTINPCSIPPFVFRLVTGVATTGSIGSIFPPNLPPPCFTPAGGIFPTFLDLQSMLPISYFPTVATGLGSFFASDWVVSLTL
jgi:hypothetical protein